MKEEEEELEQTDGTYEDDEEEEEDDVTIDDESKEAMSGIDWGEDDEADADADADDEAEDSTPPAPSPLTGAALLPPPPPQGRYHAGVLVDWEDREWLGRVMGGVDLNSAGAVRLVYDVAADPDRAAANFLDTTRRAFGADERTGGGKMLVTLAGLSTGRVVVGTTTIGWSTGENGPRKDDYAALYEVGWSQPQGL